MHLVRVKVDMLLVFNQLFLVRIVVEAYFEIDCLLTVLRALVLSLKLLRSLDLFRLNELRNKAIDVSLVYN